MKKSIKTFICIILIFLTLPLCSCKNNEKYYDELKKRFEQFTPDYSVVTVLDESYFYFADHWFWVGDVVEYEKRNYGYLFLDQMLYFSTYKNNGRDKISLRIYKCDLYGNDKSLIFEKDDCRSFIRATGKEDTIYFEHYLAGFHNQSSKVIDSYNVRTGVYAREDSGENASLSNYKKDKAVNERYTRSVEDGILTLIDKEKNVRHTIDIDLTNGALFDEALDGLKYEYKGCYISFNRFFLVYRLQNSSFLNDLYPHLVCEYDPDIKEIFFKSLVFLHDINQISIDVVLETQ